MTNYHYLAPLKKLPKCSKCVKIHGFPYSETALPTSLAVH